jgi:hypothetical protein
MALKSRLVNGGGFFLAKEMQLEMANQLRMPRSEGNCITPRQHGHDVATKGTAPLTNSDVYM